MSQNTQNIQHSLLSWYDQHKRDLPWRRTKDPYAIWVSEIMLQQTQVQTVIPYYERWMKRFPSIQKLAQATVDDILPFWEGLGYYARARNFHKAAQEIVQKYQGKIPTSAQELIQLSGIGPYTASAIASIAFDEDTPVVDGNVRRVISRLFLTPDDKDKIQEQAEKILAHGRAGDFNQAMMELGATICTPQNPQCLICPLQKNCQAFAKGLQADYPPLMKRVVQKAIKTVGGIIWKEDKILIHQRPLKGLLGGLWEFPNFRVSEKKEGSKLLQKYSHQEIGILISAGEKIRQVKHVYTHLIESLDIYLGRWVKGKIPSKNYKWVKSIELSQYPFTGICSKIRTRILNGTPNVSSSEEKKSHKALKKKESPEKVLIPT
ncbi:MAG: A/G-specific adenine glycosylase [Chlamydiae bacterium]|nr:A/G-specific adenine glycosylase [Chlamydiota bacterium]MBI3266396.1 A/G-specific adenine glycosylase [Chlamydiota bacterium]